MNILESIINKYYICSDIVLWTFIGLFLFVTVIGLVLIKKNVRYIVNRLLHNVFYIITISCIGALIYLLGLMLEIEYVYFNVLIFVIVTGVIIVYGILQSIMFKKVIIPVSQVCTNVKYVVFFEVFLLSVTKHLEIVEWIAGTLAVICMDVVVEELKKLQSNENETIVKESDYPNPDLYYTRQKQLEKFIPVLKQQKSEPYAIMISSEWGMGKSSFMMALEKRAYEDSFIWVRAGSEKSVSEIMLEISEKILDILRKNNILIEREGLIEKYFLAFAGVLAETNLGLFNKITSAFKKNKSEDTKKYLNSKLKDLKKLNKTIYLVIDDLDRCDKEYQLKMFKVIRESAQLIQCKIIFLVDKNEFLSGEYKLNDIEKYVNYTLELCKVDYEEIVSYLVDDLFDNKFIQKTNSILLKGRSVSEIKGMIYQFPSEILEKCENEISKVENDTKTKSEQEVENRQKKVNDIEETILNIKKNITNSRKVKNFLKGIKRDLENINNGIDQCSQEYQKEDWLKAIIEVHFLRNMLPDIYTSLKMASNLMEFGKSYKGYSAEIILGLKYNFTYLDNKKITILNHIIYDVDVIDFAQVKVEREKYLSELYGAKASIKHINEYIEYARSYDDFSKILNICVEQQFNSNTDREVFIKEILSTLSKQLSLFKVNNQKFLDLSKELIECLKRFELSTNEKNICVYGGQMITRRVIVDNTHFLRNILFILFEINEVQESWKTLAVTDVNEFYAMLKRIDSKSVYKGLEDETNKLLSIRTYYKNLITELQKEKYKETGLDFDDISIELNNIFEICELWLGIESILNSESSNDMELFNQYFLLDGVYSFRDAIFLHISNLKQALEALNEFYDSKSGCYESNFSLILLRVSHSVVLLYENNQEWFEGREGEISDLLIEIANKVYLLDNLQDYIAKDVIYEIRIFVYKFSSYCSVEERTDKHEDDEINGQYRSLQSSNAHNEAD